MEQVGDAFELLREDMDRLRGRLFQLAEAAGMPERQEQAFKGLVRQQTYASQAKLTEILRQNGKAQSG
jgi:hypothetical protein